LWKPAAGEKQKQLALNGRWWMMLRGAMGSRIDKVRGVCTWSWLTFFKNRTQFFLLGSQFTAHMSLEPLVFFLFEKYIYYFSSSDVNKFPSLYYHRTVGYLEGPQDFMIITKINDLKFPILLWFMHVTWPQTKNWQSHHHFKYLMEEVAYSFSWVLWKDDWAFEKNKE
jgi:hypothetical protein